MAATPEIELSGTAHDQAKSVAMADVALTAETEENYFVKIGCMSFQ